MAIIAYLNLISLEKIHPGVTFSLLLFAPEDLKIESASCVSGGERKKTIECCPSQTPTNDRSLSS